MVNEEMVNAYIDTYLGRTYAPDGDGRTGGRECVKRGIEAALSVEAFGVRAAIKQTREVFSEEPVAKDALDYLEQLLGKQGN